VNPHNHDIPLPPKPLPSRVKRLIAGARARLAWERFAPAYLVAALCLLAFAAGAFAGLWERIGDPWRGLALIAALIVLGYTIWQARTLRPPTRNAALRRLEDDNALAHRPLDTLEDSPRITERGWNDHLARAEAAARNLAPARLRKVLADRDPYYARAVVPALLIAGLAIGRGDNAERLRRALSPSWQSGIDASDASFEAWINPPDYTARRPVTLKDDLTENVPEGSEFVARITGIRDLPRLLLEQDGRERRLSSTRLGPESFEVRAILDSDAVARIRIGQRRQTWAMDVVADQSPTVAFTEPPEADKRDRLGLTFDLTDDYGVEILQLRLRPLTDDGEPEIAPESVDVPLRSAPVKSAEAQAQPLDLTRHRWAGRKAVGTLIATDGAGQTAESEPAFFTIPNKIFIEPLAKAVVENRALVLKGLRADYAPDQTRTLGALFDTFQPGLRLARAPAPIQRSAQLLDAITEYPGDAFDDPALYMGLRHAARQMRYARNLDALAGLDEDLWNMALRAEFGRLGTALEAMQRAQAQLNDAIARNAPQREVDVLFERYNEAVDRYLEVLREEAEIGDPSAGGGGGEGRNVDEIQELLDAIEEAQRIGDTEGARLALARLAELLENMQMTLTPSSGEGSGGDPSPGGEMSEEMKEKLEELAELLGEQRDLRDDTEQAERGEEDGDTPGQGEDEGNQGSGTQDGTEPTPGAGGTGSLAERQEQLGQGLGELQELAEGEEGLGDKGEEARIALEDAEDAMERAARALGEGDLGTAQDEQDAAIQSLRAAGRGIAEALREQNDSESEGEEGNNPLGQNNNGDNDPNATQDIDPRDNAQRSREILEELRRRAAEQERSREEREYLERLMERF